jgi:hypothetical protein
MKHLQTFEKYYVKDSNIIYHYTSIENAQSIIYQGELKYRRYNIQNKYLTGSASEDYGYISFTENEEYHEERNTEIPIDVRFVFNLNDLEKDFKVFTYDANQDELQDAKEINNDLNTQDIPYYGEEMELRIYEQDIPIKYIKRIETSYEIEDDKDLKQLKTLCEQNNLIYKEKKY